MATTTKALLQTPIIIDVGTIPDKKVQDIPRPDTAYTVVEAKPVEYTVLLDGKKYKVQVDENGNPVRFKRYNEKFKMYVAMTFSPAEQPEAEATLLQLLKSSYISRVTGAMTV